MMKSALLKAAAKKAKYFSKPVEDESDTDSNASLTSDDEEEVSKGMLNEIFNDKYLCLKYLGRGTFSRVWCVIDIVTNKYYAMKTVFPKYYEDSLHEIEISKIVHTPEKANNVINMVDSFDLIENNKKTKCIVTELLGITINDLFEDNFSEYDKLSNFEGSEKDTDEYTDEDTNEDTDIDTDTEEHTDEETDEQDNSNIEKTHDKIDSDDDAQYRAPSIRLFKKMIIDILRGLQEMHKKNLIHTDLKFENIMIDILDKKIINLQEKINLLDIPNKYEEFIRICLPENYNNFDKMKRKKVKRKSKIKALKLLSIYMNNNNIPNYNNESEKLTFEELENIPFESFNFKVIDLGNTENNNNKQQDEIMIRNYRPPENIMNEYYDCKADIWCLGCLCYELLTGRYLFDIPKMKKSIDRDRKHLHQMFEILGKIPKNLTQQCDFSEDLFDNKGRILKNKKCNFTNLEEILKDESKYDINEIKHLSEFLNKLLDYNLETRYSSFDALNDKWLCNIN